MTTWLERKKPNPNHLLPVLCLYSGTTWGLASERQLGRLLLRKGNLLLEFIGKWTGQSSSAGSQWPCASGGLHGPPCTDTPNSPACTPGPGATLNQPEDVQGLGLYPWWQCFSQCKNNRIGKFNSLLPSLTPLYDWLCSSSFVRLSSSIKGLREVLPVNPIWAPATADADTFSLSEEEYVSLDCIKTLILHLSVFCKMLYLQHQEKSSPKNAICKSCVIRVLFSKFMSIRSHFHFVNAEVITSNVTLNIFSPCLTMLILSLIQTWIPPKAACISSLELHFNPCLYSSRLP